MQKKTKKMVRRGEKKEISGILEEMTIDDVRSLKPNVGVIPIGSTEPHGPALPYGSDNFGTGHVCYGATRLANSRGAKVLCLPVQRISLNNNFYGFPFACRIRVPVFMQLVRDLVDIFWREEVRRMLIVNGHGGNTDVLKAVQRDLADRRGLFLGMVETDSCASPEAMSLIEHGSDHAGEAETSRNLYLRPDLVRTGKIADNPRKYPKLQVLNDYDVAFVRPWHLYVPESAGGDARKATKKKGEKIIKSSVDGMARLLCELSKAPDTKDFPY